MRCSSIVALLVVTASFALGGCAADAEPAAGTDNATIALQAPAIEQTDSSRTGDVREGAKVGDLRAEQKTTPLDAAKARDGLKVSDVSGVSGVSGNSRIEVFPSPFGRVPTEKLGPVPSVRPLNQHEEAIGTAIPSVRPLNQYERAVEVDEAFLPFSHDDKP